MESRSKPIVPVTTGVLAITVNGITEQSPDEERNKGGDILLIQTVQACSSQV